MPLDNISELKRRVPGGKYALTRAVAERARQLQSGETPLVEVRTPNPLSVAIDEICQGKVSFAMHTEEAVQAAAEANAADGTADILPVVSDESPEPIETESAESAPSDPESTDGSSDGLL